MVVHQRLPWLLCWQSTVKLQRSLSHSKSLSHWDFLQTAGSILPSTDNMPFPSHLLCSADFVDFIHLFFCLIYLFTLAIYLLICLFFRTHMRQTCLLSPRDRKVWVQRWTKRLLKVRVYLAGAAEGYYLGMERKVVSLSLMEVKSPRENGRGIRYGD